MRFHSSSQSMVKKKSGSGSGGAKQNLQSREGSPSGSPLSPARSAIDGAAPKRIEKCDSCDRWWCTCYPSLNSEVDGGYYCLDCWYRYQQNDTSAPDTTSAREKENNAKGSKARVTISDVALSLGDCVWTPSNTHSSLNSHHRSSLAQHPNVLQPTRGWP